MIALVLNPFAKLLAGCRGIAKAATGNNPGGAFDLRQFLGQFIGPGGLSGESFSSGARNIANEFRMSDPGPQLARAPVQAPPPQK